MTHPTQREFNRAISRWPTACPAAVYFAILVDDYGRRDTDAVMDLEDNHGYDGKASCKRDRDNNGVCWCMRLKATPDVRAREAKRQARAWRELFESLFRP